MCRRFCDRDIVTALFHVLLVSDDGKLSNQHVQVRVVGIPISKPRLKYVRVG